MNEKELIEQIGRLANELVAGRNKQREDENVKFVLGSPVYLHTVDTCGQSMDSHLYVNAVIDDEIIGLSGEHSHYSGVQHEPSFSGRIFGDESLIHLYKESVAVQLAYLYTVRGKKKMKIVAEYSEEYGDWESGNNTHWKVRFDFP